MALEGSVRSGRSSSPSSSVLTIVNGVETHDFADATRKRSRSLVTNSTRYQPRNHTNTNGSRVLPAVGFREVRALMHRLESSLVLHSGPCTDGTDALPSLTAARTARVVPHGRLGRTDCAERRAGAVSGSKPAREPCVGARRQRSRTLPTELSCDRERRGFWEEGAARRTKRCPPQRRLGKRKAGTTGTTSDKAESRYIWAEHGAAEMRRVRR